MQNVVRSAERDAFYDESRRQEKSHERPANMTQPVRIALVGTGQIGRQSHLPAALSCADVEVTALVDPSIDRAHALATEFGIRPLVASNISEVVGSIDAAIIASPNHTHRDIALRCLEADVSVLIEKPLAHNYSDGAELVAAADRSSAVLAVGYCLRFRHNVLLLKSLLDSNYFGRVRRFVHQAGTAGGWAPVSGYNLDRANTGGGVLVVTGSHFLDRMLNFWGYPDELAFWDDSHGGPEANCRANFWFRRPGGTIEGCTYYSKTVPMPAQLIIEAERGIVIAADSDEAEIVFRPDGDTRFEQIIRPRGNSPIQDDVFRLQIEDFADAHRRRRPPRVDGRQGLESMRLIDSLYTVRRSLSENWYEITARE